jgi:protein-glutamine gamma-glutamyltransferase
MMAAPRLQLRLGLAHEVGLATAVSASVALVLLGGEFPAFAWLVAVAPWVGALLKSSGVRVPGVSGTLIGLGGLTLAGGTLSQGGLESSVLALTQLILGLVAGRVLVRNTPEHDTQALGLSVLLVLAGSVLNVTLTFFPLFVLYAVAAVWALATRQLLAGAAAGGANDRLARARTDVVTPSFFAGTGAVALGVLLSAAALFLMFPRVGVGDIGGFVKRKDKLPTNVGLRGDPRALGGTGVVARVEGVGQEEWERGLYLRGVVYDVVNLDGFSQSERRMVSRQSKLILADDEPKNARYTVMATPAIGDHVLMLGSVRVARTLAGGTMNKASVVPIIGRTIHDELRTGAVIDSPLRYEVLGGIAHAAAWESAPKQLPDELDADDPQTQRYRALPAGFDEELRALADSVAGTGTLETQTAALRSFLLSQFKYGLDPPRFDERPVRAFLLESRQGHCEFFAAAFALLLRSRGVAARVIGGYQGGVWDEGVIVFQERHAHAWVEWFLPGVGWVVDDATPVPSEPRERMTGLSAAMERVRRFWDDQVLDFAFEDQIAALSRAQRVSRGVSLRDGALLALIVVGVLGARALWSARPSRRKTQSAAPLGVAIVRCVERVTTRPVRSCLTLREAVHVVPAAHPARASLEAALAAYERARFGGDILPASVVGAHVRALRRATIRRQSAR